MGKNDLPELLARLQRGELEVSEALREIGAKSGFANLDFARIDHDRKRRCGFPEFVFGEGKSLAQMIPILHELADNGGTALATRIDSGTLPTLKREFPTAVIDETARILLLNPPQQQKGKILIATAGTTDLPVALEAKYTAIACACGVEMISDAGVAGIHRLFAEMNTIQSAEVLIVVAGMEGALPSVAGGLVPCPVIAVPTSVGYGSSLGGLTALFGMLNSCANGILVTNIDNGFGAACAAARIINTIYREQTDKSDSGNKNAR